jgi:uncharacterized membrane protein YidH (DUF202 family)
MNNNYSIIILALMGVSFIAIGVVTLWYGIWNYYYLKKINEYKSRHGLINPYSTGGFIGSIGFIIAGIIIVIKTVQNILNK